jgi:hypothetical protein
MSGSELVRSAGFCKHCDDFGLYKSEKLSSNQATVKNMSRKFLPDTIYFHAITYMKVICLLTSFTFVYTCTFVLDICL